MWVAGALGATLVFAFAPDDEYAERQDGGDGGRRTPRGGTTVGARN